MQYAVGGDQKIMVELLSEGNHLHRNLVKQHTL